MVGSIKKGHGEDGNRRGRGPRPRPMEALCWRGQVPTGVQMAMAVSK